MMASSANSVVYKESPNQQQLEDDFDRFLISNERFQGKIKVGKTFLEKIGSRYSATDKYEQLTTAHIFARCSTVALALEVEKRCQDIAKSRDMLIYRCDNGKGGLGKKIIGTPIVYVTQFKDNLFTCPLDSCLVVMTREGIEEHKWNHSFITKMMKLNKLERRLGRGKLDINIDPVPWIPDDHDKKSLKCQYCDQVFGYRLKMVRHSQKCEKNPNQREKLICPICKEEVTHNLNRHMLTHTKADQFTCPTCNKTMPKTSKARHLKLHDPSQYQPCPTCGKSVVKHDMKSHLESHQPRPKMACELCGVMIPVKGKRHHMKTKHRPTTN